MDTPLTRAEHEEFRRTVEAKFEKLGAEDVRLNKRISELESDNRQIQELTVNVQKLTDNMETMRQMQADSDKRLKAIEGKDGDMWRTVVKYAVTVVVGILVGYALNLIGIG